MGSAAWSAGHSFALNNWIGGSVQVASRKVIAAQKVSERQAKQTALQMGKQV